MICRTVGTNQVIYVEPPTKSAALDVKAKKCKVSECFVPRSQVPDFSWGDNCGALLQKIVGKTLLLPFLDKKDRGSTGSVCKDSESFSCMVTSALLCRDSVPVERRLNPSLVRFLAKQRHLAHLHVCPQADDCMDELLVTNKNELQSSLSRVQHLHVTYNVEFTNFGLCEIDYLRSLVIDTCCGVTTFVFELVADSHGMERDEILYLVNRVFKPLLPRLEHLELDVPLFIEERGFFTIMMNLMRLSNLPRLNTVVTTHQDFNESTTVFRCFGELPNLKLLELHRVVFYGEDPSAMWVGDSKSKYDGFSHLEEIRIIHYNDDHLGNGAVEQLIKNIESGYFPSLRQLEIDPVNGWNRRELVQRYVERPEGRVVVTEHQWA